MLQAERNLSGFHYREGFCLQAIQVKFLILWILNLKGNKTWCGMNGTVLWTS